MKKVSLYTVIVLLLFTGVNYAEQTDTTELMVHVIDVGHGDCIFIETPDDGIDDNGECEGYRILIDAGEVDGAAHVIPYLKNLGLKRDDTLDYIITSHAHTDHIGGMLAIYDTFQVNNTLDPGYSRDIYTFVWYFEKARDEPNSNFYFNLVDSGLIEGNGDYLDWGDELDVRILHTNPDVVEQIINHSSIVLWMKYGETSFLFMGDAEGKSEDEPADSIVRFVEKYLLATYDESVLDCDVLKVANHGSETSSTSAFIDAVRPSHVIICAGCEYDLPKETVIQRYEDFRPKIKIWRTDEGDEGLEPKEARGDDHILIESDGRRVKAGYVALD